MIAIFRRDRLEYMDQKSEINVFLENDKYVRGSHLFRIFRLRFFVLKYAIRYTCNTVNDYRFEAISAKFHEQKDKLQEVINTSKA